MQQYLQPSKSGKKKSCNWLPGRQTVTSLQLNITDQTGEHTESQKRLGGMDHRGQGISTLSAYAEILLQCHCGSSYL